MVWQLQELEALAAEPSPDPSKVERFASQVSQFLSSAPTDFLEPLMTSPFGRVVPQHPHTNTCKCKGAQTTLKFLHSFMLYGAARPRGRVG